MNGKIAGSIGGITLLSILGITLFQPTLFGSIFSQTKNETVNNYVIASTGAPENTNTPEKSPEPEETFEPEDTTEPTALPTEEPEPEETVTPAETSKPTIEKRETENPIPPEDLEENATPVSKTESDTSTTTDSETDTSSIPGSDSTIDTTLSSKYSLSADTAKQIVFVADSSNSYDSTSYVTIRKRTAKNSDCTEEINDNDESEEDSVGNESTISDDTYEEEVTYDFNEICNFVQNDTTINYYTYVNVNEGDYEIELNNCIINVYVIDGIESIIDNSNTNETAEPTDSTYSED